MNKIVIFIFFVMLTIIILYSITNVLNKNFLTPNSIFSEEQNKNTEKKINNGQNSQGNYQKSSGNSDSKMFSETKSGSGSGGGSGSTTNQNNPSQEEKECYETQIPYSLKNFTRNSVCNAYNGEICVDRTIICSTEVQNLDKETGGLFIINVKFFDYAVGEHSQLALIQKEKNVNPLSTETIEAALNLQGEDANKNIGCIFTTQQVPKKIVCY